MSKQIEKTKENLDKCNCLSCPSFTTSCKVKEMPHNLEGIQSGLENISHLEGMFCAYEKSRCINQPLGCGCAVCKLRDEYGLENNYYCLSTGGK